MAHEQGKLALSRRDLLVAGAAAGAAGTLQLALPTFAHATELSEKLAEQEKISQKIVELRLELERDTDAYHKTIEDHDAAEVAVKKAQAKIDANTELIESLQEKLMERMRTQYRSDEMGVYDVLLASADFEEFATRWTMIERLNSSDTALVGKIKDLRSQNEAEKTELESQEEVARQKMDEAKQIEEACQAKITETEKLLEQITEETEEMIRRDQEEALSRSTAKVSIIGNPRNLPPTPEVVDVARSCMGIPYVWGGKGPDVFDCSGLVAWCYGRVGIGITSYTESEYALALAVGAVLPLSEVEPGDVLYRPGHVGIAANKGGVPYIHAPHTGAVVRDTDTLAYSKFVCGLRFPRGLHITYISEDVSSYQNAARNGALSTGIGATAGSAVASNAPTVTSSTTTVYADADTGAEVEVTEPTDQSTVATQPQTDTAAGTSGPTILVPGSAAYNGFDED